MLLKEFMETDTYKDAGYINYVGADGMEIEWDEEDLLDGTVIGYHKYSEGCLEIKLNII